MVATAAITAALETWLAGSGLLETVTVHGTDDLDASLERLRDSPTSMAVIVPGADTLEHRISPGSNDPVYSEVRCHYDILLTSRTLDMRLGGDAAAAPLKDSVLAALLWDDLSLPGIVVFPDSCEPMVIETDRGRGREAWKLALTVRQLVFSS